MTNCVHVHVIYVESAVQQIILAAQEILIKNAPFQKKKVFQTKPSTRPMHLVEKLISVELPLVKETLYYIDLIQRQVINLKEILDNTV